MNPGIVFALGLACSGLPFLGVWAWFVRTGGLRGRGDAFGGAVLVATALWIVAWTGLYALAAYTSPCGTTSHGRWKWQGNACIDTSRHKGPA